jgi:hypothetical protein
MIGLLIELLICSIVTPPTLDKHEEWNMMDGYYTMSINDVVTVITLLKSYILIRLYYHYSRWTTPAAEELCKI